MTTNLLPVSQAAREAAAEYQPGYAKAYRSGHLDQSGLAQAFARFEHSLARSGEREPAPSSDLREAAKRAMHMLQTMGDTEEGVTLAFRTLAEAIND